ncbi:glycerol dehydrogenase [Limosilactobacillus mucosae]|uniref:glycerol dehydrogenase n=1 Tax=Limosilactobacillus mucosae TaxID=97478 RepID=UPI003994D620
MSINMFGSPASYLQGSDVLFKSAEYLARLGNRVLLLAGPTSLKIVGNELGDYLINNDFTVTKVEFNGESSDTEIKRVTKIGLDNHVEMVIGLGGGKTIDAAKAIADNLSAKTVIMPTVASTDAPCSRLSVIYQDSGEFDHYRFYNQNPDLVMVDTKVIATAPAKLLACGMADAMATNVEAQAVKKSHGLNMLGEHQTLVGLAIAQECENTLFKFGDEAYAAAITHTDTKAFDRIIEANTLMSGVGFESGGLAAAHAINDALSVLDGPVHDKLHGEKVAFGILTQLMLEGADTERFEKYFAFLKKLHLPTNFVELGIEDPSDENLLKVGQAACAPNDTMNRMPFEVVPQDVVNAMRGVDAYSVARLSIKSH